MSKNSTKINTVINGDCLDELKELPDNSVDSVVTDPPYGLSKEPDIAEVLSKWVAGEPYDHGHGGFMGKSWDSFVPHPDIWREVHRVLKPGGHALVFAGTRTQDLMTISLRLAGFEVRDVIEWLYFSGFPKSLNVGKAFDRRAKAEREVVGYAKGRSSAVHGGGQTVKQDDPITLPTTDLARKWDGWGTALKPSHEPIIVVRKPFKGSVAGNVEKHGTAAINIDASRIATFGEDAAKHKAEWDRTQSANQSDTTTFLTPKEKEADLRAFAKDGRFPANCITLDSDEFYSKYFNVSPQEVSKKASKGDRNSNWQGEEITLEPSFTQTMGDGISKREHNPANKGAYNGNSHPTVKPIDLMAWLVRLVTPPNGTILDPFAGSGSTLVAAKREGFRFIGIEREAEYVEIIKARTGLDIGKVAE